MGIHFTAVTGSSPTGSELRLDVSRHVNPRLSSLVWGKSQPLLSDESASDIPSVPAMEGIEHVLLTQYCSGDYAVLWWVLPAEKSVQFPITSFAAFNANWPLFGGSGSVWVINGDSAAFEANSEAVGILPGMRGTSLFWPLIAFKTGSIGKCL